MSQQYDVIVVGAGNGGLAAAATAAAQGAKTLLLERHNLPGGCATSFVRGRFEFEPALHELGGNKKDGTGSIDGLMKAVGAHINWCFEDQLFRTIVKDTYDVTFPTGIDRYFTCIDKEVPGSMKGLKKLYAAFENCNEAVAYVASTKGKPNGMTMMMKYGRFMSMSSHSAKAVMDEYGIPQRAQDLIATNWGYLGVPIDEINAFHFFQMLFELIINCPSMPPHRSHEMSMALADAVYKHGGEIRCLCPVTHFLYDENHTMIGVVAGGQEIYGKRIIADINPNTVYNLSDPQDVPKRNNQVANARSFGVSFLAIYLGLDCTADELGFPTYSLFVSDSTDTREQYEQMGNGCHYSVNCLNRGVPGASPEGTSMLMFTISLYEEAMPKDLTAAGYKKWKNAIAKRYITDLEETLHIQIIDHIEEISVATPVTFARYLGSPKGTVYGYDASDWDNIMARRSAEGSDNEIGHLSFTGSAAWMGDGYGCAYTTGQAAAAKAVAEIRKEAN